MIKITIIFLILSLIVASSTSAYADIVWPAIYVADSHFHFWLLLVFGLFIEALIFFWVLKMPFRKALAISTIVNLISSTVGSFLMVLSMLGWHLVVDNFVNGTFAPFNLAATLILMYFGSACIEALAIKIIWKYKFVTIIPIFLLGNLLSYIPIAVRLYIGGGWNKTM